MRMLLLVCAFLLLASVAPSATPSPVGKYDCHGTQNGVSYDLVLEINEFGHTYRFMWGDPPSVLGLGLLQDGRIAVAIVSPSSGAVGVGFYSFIPGRLEGLWSRGDGSIDSEVCRQGRAA